MMQHVATAKSEVAAFATDSQSSFAQTSSDSGKGTNEQFGELLINQQTELHVDNNGLDKKSVEPKTQTESQEILVSSENKGDHADPVFVEQKAQQVVSKGTPESDLIKHENIGEQHAESADVEHQCLDGKEQHWSNQGSELNNVELEPDFSTQYLILEQNIDITSGQQISLESDLEVTNAMAKLEPDLSNLSDSPQPVTVDDSASVIPQHWVSLVDNLQKLYRETATDNPLVDKPVQLADIATEDLRMPNQLVEGVEGESHVLAPAEAIAVAVEQALTEASQSPEVLTQKGNLKSKAIEILLDDEAQLQKLVAIQSAQIAPSVSNAGDERITDQLTNTSDSLESTELVDITEANNLSLLKVLMSDQTALDTQSPSRSSTIQEEVLKAATEVNKESLATQVSSVDKPLDVKPLSPQLTEVDTFVAEADAVVQDKSLNITSFDTPVQSAQQTGQEANKLVHSLINLPETKLDKVLENIAQRLTDTVNSVAVNPVINEQSAQQVVNAKASDMLTLVDSSSKEMVAQLKTGLEEFKNQLAQGREPGLDLKALVSDAVLKSTDKIAEKSVLAAVAIQSEQSVKTVSQVLDMANVLNQAMERQHDQTYSTMSREVSQIQAEQSKQSQLNLFESKFEKAINITKPEGHQQLAEKVRWMVNTKNLIADIRLDPAELGSVQVKVAVSGESATVNFVVQSQHARDAVDTATPRLREMLAEKGIELGQSSVRQENGAQQDQADAQQSGGQLAGGQSHNGEEETDQNMMPDAAIQQKVVNGALGGIDYFV